MTVFIFGNAILEQDNSPVQLIPKLEKQFPNIKFIHADPTEGWQREEKNIVILDTVVGLTKVTKFDSLDAFQNSTGKLTVHDYDLYMDLALLLKIGTIESITIIGMPPDQKQLTPEIINKIHEAIKI